MATGIFMALIDLCFENFLYFIGQNFIKWIEVAPFFIIFYFFKQ
jgi:hypothetical protein